MTTTPRQRATERVSAPRKPLARKGRGWRIPVSAMTLEGFRDWATSEAFPQDLRASFLGEEILLEMSNEDPDTHVSVKGEISRVLMNLVREEKLGKFFTDGVLVTHEVATVANNPDAFFFTLESFQSGRVRMIRRKNQPERYREVEGAPDWMLEVVSDSSEEKDTVELREAYHRAGVAEYWLVDARGEEVEFQILHRRRTGFAAVPVREGWQRSRVFGREFRLERRRDDFGMWEYELLMR